MAINKAHQEFYQVDMNEGWETPKGYPSGIQQKILAGTLDVKNRQGGHTRLLRFRPGTYTTVPFEHDYWEEVYVIEGDLWVGNDAHGQGGVRFGPATYCCRPPHVPHGPFRTEQGCLLLEQHYYDPQ
ncbi:cupin domain-containing protein [Delftia sp. UME58]|uniref:cupin domain-containing protein n=1 Tax=Delftia sp. UME58 TaxID=1862322 RepID=UPI00160044F9|nr:cupin domain-containing protein [Delftia sp. UME58]MBB1653267.1 cupin [Delftia sp. UME58]